MAAQSESILLIVSSGLIGFANGIIRIAEVTGYAVTRIFSGLTARSFKIVHKFLPIIALRSSERALAVVGQYGQTISLKNYVNIIL